MADYPHINSKYITDITKLERDCDTYFEQGLASKFFYMRTWLQNINFHAGNQWLVYDESKQVFELEPQLDDEVRLVINKIMPAVRMAVGRVTQDKKRPIVVPRNQDEDVIEAAKVSTQLLEHEERTSYGEYREKQVWTWAVLCGKGYTKKFWDDDRKQICTEVISPFEIIVPPNVLRPEKFPWICHARYETRAWVYEKYGLEVEGTSDWGQFGVFLAAVKNVMQDGNFTGIYTQGMDDNVLVKDWWIRPCKEYPEGALVITVNDKVVYADKNPWVKDVPKYKNIMPWDKFYWPFAEADYIDAVYRYWPISLVENLVDPQKWINEFHSANIMNLQYSNSPTYWAQEGTVVADEVSKKPGIINFHSGPQAPTVDPVRSIDPLVFNEASALESTIYETGGIIGPGSLPPGIRAAAALALINEQNRMADTSASLNHERWLMMDAKQTLYLYKNFGPQSLEIRVMGEEGHWQVAEWKRGFVADDEEIKIESKQELAQDKMTRFDQVMKLMTTPKPDDPIMDIDQGLRMLELEKDAGIVTPRILNVNMAGNENEQLWDGQHVEVFEYEDHKIHMETHLQDMLSTKFKQAEQHIRAVFIQHYRDHQQFINASQAQNTASSQVAQTPLDQQGGAMPQPQQQMGATGLAGPLQASMNRMNTTLNGGPQQY